MNNIDKDQIRGLNNGNRDIFNIVFKSYYAVLCLYVNGIVKSIKIAEEIVQEVFVRLWENHANINIEVSLKAYLYRCVHNSSLNYLRDSKKYLHRQVNLDQVPNIENLYSYDSEWFYVPERLEKMEEILYNEIQNLPAQCRTIFQLCRYENLSYPQIAEKLSISISTVKTQMGRAMSKLKEAMDKQGYHN